MKFELIILGSSSATPTLNRNPTSQLLNINEKYYLIDCGEGTQNQLLRFGIRSPKIDYIFISHLHGDHYLGLIGLLSSLHLNGRIKPMYLYGPPQLEEIIQIQFNYSQTQLRYPLIFNSTNSEISKKIFENQDIIVETIPLDHRIPCTGFKFSEKKRLPKIIKEKVEQLEIPIDQIPLIKKGFSFTDKGGKIHLHEDLTTEPDQPKVYAYCSDTICSWNYLSLIKNADVLYHEATFMNNMLERAQETFHTTALQAGEIALKANAKKLIIGHFSARYHKLEPLLEECKTAFSNSFFGNRGAKV